jgi:hypothetical protein
MSPYIGVARVTTVTWTKRQQLTSKQDMLTMAATLTLPLIALDGTQHPCTLYFFDCDLTTVMSRTVLGTVMVGKPPLCTLSS